MKGVQLDPPLVVVRVKSRGRRVKDTYSSIGKECTSIHPWFTTPANSDTFSVATPSNR
jgi:hypothetical protein